MSWSCSDSRDMPHKAYYFRLPTPLTLPEWYQAKARIQANGSVSSFSPFLDYGIHRVVGIFCSSEDEAILIKLLMG